MRDFKIAVADSAGAYRWKNITVRWEKLCERLKSPTRTAETAAQYHAMSRDEKGKAKDGGGFVGGYLKDERRLAANVTCRSLLTLDADAA